MNNRMMITFDAGGRRFNFRSIAVLIEQGKVLVHKAGGQDFWTLPGGRVELGETAADTIIREVKEEIGIDAQASRLLWVVENFFHHDSMDYHELSLFFLIDTKAVSVLESIGKEFTTMDEKVPLFFSWLPLDSLHDVPLYPTFLRDSLSKLPQSTVYFKHEDK